jgi:gas vesicle protein
VNFANHLKQRAQDEESPLLREQLEKDADAIKKKAQEFIDAVNRYLEDPTNPEKERDVQKKMDELRKLINDASNRVRENQTDLPSDIQGVPSLQALANGTNKHLTHTYIQHTHTHTLSHNHTITLFQNRETIQ